MDRDRTDEKGRQTVQRVIWRLLAFAALAGRAGAMALPLRFVLLWILRGAEARARPIVMGMAGECGYRLVLPSAIVTRTGGTQADAERLALCYRALARALSDLLRDESHAAAAWRESPHAACLLRRMARALCAWPQAPGSGSLRAGMAHDTS